MDCLSDYDIQNDNSQGLTSTFTVKHKPSGKLFKLESIPCQDLHDNEQKALAKRIKIRINLSHPNILPFYDYIEHNDIIYIKQEFCKHGNLSQFIQKECIEKERQLHEDLICRILYQTVLALKTVECFMGYLSLDSILLTEQFNIKLYNFFHADGTNKNQKQKEIKMSQLGFIIFELCTLKPLDKTTFEALLQEQDYSETFKGLTLSMIKDSSEIKKHINKILCHPTVLLQSSQWTKDKCFMERKQETLKKAPSLTSSSESIGQDYAEKLEKLRTKEVTLQIKEQLLKEQERKLLHKEKKLQIMERTVKDKLQQAELYLKRCREGGKSISSGRSRASSKSRSSTKMSHGEEVDPSYVSCGDSEILPTSLKLQVDKIVKPQNFSRTMSERRIRFKTSPLKDHNFARKNNTRKSLVKRPSKILEEPKDVRKENVIVPSKDSSSLTRRKSLFISNDYENDVITINPDYNKMPVEVNNRGWTEETKKYAFEMLRMMNTEENKENVEIKHTYL